MAAPAGRHRSALRSSDRDIALRPDRPIVAAPARVFDFDLSFVRRLNMPLSRVALGAASLLLYSRAAHARPITLDEALSAVDQSPSLGAAAATVDEATGRLDQASAYTYNPSLAGSFGVARSNGGTFFDFEVTLSQSIELGGKRRARKAAATAVRSAATEDVAALRAVVRAEVRRAFGAALVADSRVLTTTAAETWAIEFRDAALERMRLGAATQTEVNVAAANLGRAIASNKAAQRDVLLARQALAAALGLSGTDLEPTGTLPAFIAPALDEDQLVAAAVAKRRDLAAAELTRAAGDARVELADAMAVPDPALSIGYQRDAVDSAHAIVVGVSIDLPFWNRNQGERHATRAAVKRASIERDSLRATIERDVRAAARRYLSALEGVAAFDQQVVGSLAENLNLARETLAAGKLGLLEVNAVRRDLVDSQLTYLDTLAEAVEARAVLEAALGRSLEEAP